jgi:integrase/recombinase XerD
MTQEVRAMLLMIFEKKLNGQFLFVEKDGSEVKYAHIYRRFHLAQDKAGITNKIRFHDLRHSFASNYMMNGGNVFDLQKLLGHTKIEIG